MRLTILVATILWATKMATADVVMTVNPAGSPSPFSITSGYNVSYNPSDGIGPAPDGYTYWLNWVPTTNWGNTGYNAIQSHYVLGQAPELDMLISNLHNQIYEVYAQVFTNSGIFPGIGDEEFGAYGSRIGLTADNLTIYSHASGGTLLATGDSAPIVGQYEIREFDLGSELAAGGNLNVFLADFHTLGEQVTANLVGLRLAVLPEPSSIMLASLGLLALVHCSWQKARRKST